jgi:hypothetical protein
VFDSSVVIFDCDVSARRAKCNIYSVVCVFFVLMQLSMVMLPHTTEAICTNALLCPLKEVGDEGRVLRLNRRGKSWITLMF